MKTNPELIARLATLCADWGGHLEALTCLSLYNDDRDIAVAPFDNKVGVNWAGKIVFYRLDASPYSIIHEMGHVFASKFTPYKSNEMDFFAWERAVVSMIGGSMREWNRQNAEYTVYAVPDDPKTSCEYGHLTAKERATVLKVAYQTALEKGLIDPVTRKPLAIR